MNPLAVEIWLFLLLAYVLVSLSMWVVARFTPYEWHDNLNGSGVGSRCHHCHHYLSGSVSSIGAANQISLREHQHNPDVMMASEQPVLASSNDFSLANSFWFTIGTLMQQGSDLNPKVFGYLPSLAFVPQQQVWPIFTPLPSFPTLFGFHFILFFLLLPFHFNPSFIVQFVSLLGV